MTRLIDADRLKAHVKMQTDLLRNFSSISELGELATVMADGFEREVDIQPTVDAEPVKYGKWEWKKYPNGHETWECSVCRSPMITRFWYCPNCGAKMESENETD